MFRKLYFGNIQTELFFHKTYFRKLVTNMNTLQQSAYFGTKSASPS